MTDVQQTIQENSAKPSFAARMGAFAVFAGIMAGFIVLWTSEKGYLNLTYLLGICGFKQRFGLPCPGCGWTHAGQQFVTGHIFKAFYLQPAAAVFCVVGVIVSLFALHYALFGIKSKTLQRVFSPAGIKIYVIAAVTIIIAGWLVNLVRTILENQQ